MTTTLKAQARQIFLQTLQQIDVSLAVAHNLHVQGSQLHIAGTFYDIEHLHNLIIVAIGKAATPMYEAVLRQLDAVAHIDRKLQAIVVSPSCPSGRLGSLLYFEGAHPLPDATSRKAAEAVLHLLEAADADTLVLFLISGGSSAMLELPLDPRISTSDVREFYGTLVASGLAIAEINVLRKHLSAVKGGRLAAVAAPARQHTLIVSDVGDGALDMVGSGPSLPDSSSTHLCLELYHRLQATHPLPGSVRRFFESDPASDRGDPNARLNLEAGLTPTLKAHDPVFNRASWTSILSSQQLARTATGVASAAGFTVMLDNHCDEWNSLDAAQYLLDRSAHLASRGGRSCLLSVGELSVHLHGATGVGGRNQHFALQCAIELTGKAKSTTVLSAGTDGVDGNSPAAGATADADTCTRALAHAIDPAQALRAYDSFPLFAALGDALLTGPTGTNLRDLRLILS